jgi:hypothetical protein
MLGWESAKHWANAAIDLLRLAMPFLRRRDQETAGKIEDRIVETREIQETSQTTVQIQRVLIVKTTSRLEHKEKAAGK